MSEAETAAFLRAVGDGDRDTARDMLAANPALANAVGPHPYWGGRPQALHVAIETKRRDMFDLLLNAGADKTWWGDIFLPLNDKLLSGKIDAATFVREGKKQTAEHLATG